jgi:hypothetical protein
MIEEMNIEQGKLLLPAPRTASIRYVYFDNDGNLEIQENKYPADIKCISFCVFGDETVEDLKGNIYNTAHKFGVEKIVYRTQPLSYKDTPNFVNYRDCSADCVCYLIVDGDVNV